MLVLFVLILIVKAIILPSQGIFVDVFCNLVVIFLISDHVVVKRSLPNRKSNPFRHITFHLPNDSRYRYRRRGGYHPPAVIHNAKNHMYMIGHNHILHQFNIEILLGDFLYGIFHNKPV